MHQSITIDYLGCSVSGTGVRTEQLGVVRGSVLMFRGGPAAIEGANLAQWYIFSGADFEVKVRGHKPSEKS